MRNQPVNPGWQTVLLAADRACHAARYSPGLDRHGTIPTFAPGAAPGFRVLYGADREAHFWGETKRIPLAGSEVGA
jgi:hypothetical protein